MGKISLCINRIKNTSEFASIEAHNARTNFCQNADPTRTFMNRVMVNRSASVMEYYHNLLKSTGNYFGGLNRKIYASAVHALDICVRVPKSEEVNNPKFQSEKFSELCKEWVCDNFGGEKNIAQMVLHLDEVAPHVHALVIPLTADGRLCATDFIGSKKALFEYQDSIAKILEPLGLIRGERRGKAIQHVEIKEYYSDIAKARRSELPSPESGEELQHYYERANAEFKIIRSQDIEKAHQLQLKLTVANGNTPNEWEQKYHELQEEYAGSIRTEQEKLIAEKKKFEAELVKIKSEIEEKEQTILQQNAELSNAKIKVRTIDLITYALENHLVPESKTEPMLALMKECKHAAIKYRETHELDMP